MVQLKIVLDSRRSKADGTYSVIFRITNYKDVFTISSGISLLKEHWDESQRQVSREHPNSLSLNAALSKRYYEIQRAILKLDGNSFSINRLKVLLNPERPKTVINKSFKTFADKVILDMISVKRTGNAIVYQTAVNRFIQFCGNSKITFQEMDYSTLDSFSRALFIEGIKQNSVSNYFRSLRAIYNKAIKAKLVERSNYPFLDIKIKTEQTAKRAILREDIRKLEQFDLPENTASHRALQAFLLSFYLIGTSFTDMAYLKKENLILGRVEYKRRKTHKLYSVKVSPQASLIISNLQQRSGKYLFPVLPDNIIEDSLEAKKLIHQWIKTTNKYLKRLGESREITGKLTTYVARHTFATTAKRLGYSNELIAEALGHEYGNKITNIYLDTFEKQIVDEMHLKVIS